MLAMDPDGATIESWLSRREQGEPLEWILGHAELLGHRLVVDPGVYVPRPQSAELASRASALLPERGRAADLCTGSGAIAACLRTAVPSALVVATELDPLAARCARRNGVHVVLGDLDGGLAGAAFDVVTAVAPYVPTGALHLLPADVQRYEPARALDGGRDGLDVVRRVVEGAARLLRPGGWLLAEIGGSQDLACAPILDQAGFATPLFWHDEDGDLRGLAARLVGGVPVRTRATVSGSFSPG